MFVIVLEILQIKHWSWEKGRGGKWISALFYELSYSFARKTSFLGEVVDSRELGKRCPTLSTLVAVPV